MRLHKLGQHHLRQAEVGILLEVHALVPNQVGAIKLKIGFAMLQLQPCSPRNLHVKAWQVVHICKELANVRPICGCGIFLHPDPHLLVIKRDGVTIQLLVVAGLLCQVVVRQLDIGLPIQGQLRQQAIGAKAHLLLALLLRKHAANQIKVWAGAKAKVKVGLTLPRAECTCQGLGKSPC